LGLADPGGPGGRGRDHDRPHLPPRPRLRAHRAQAVGAGRADQAGVLSMRTRARFSPRRKALLAAVLLALAAMTALRLVGIAGFNGTQPREMDWNDYGVATCNEIWQGYSVHAIHVSRVG